MITTTTGHPGGRSPTAMAVSPSRFDDVVGRGGQRWGGSGGCAPKTFIVWVTGLDDVPGHPPELVHWTLFG